MNFRFSALQRAEIAEILSYFPRSVRNAGVSVLFNEPKLLKLSRTRTQRHPPTRFSALQRAEIAEMRADSLPHQPRHHVSVLFNEPKLLKSALAEVAWVGGIGFSALQRAEIAEMSPAPPRRMRAKWFQCSSTSRNC